MCEARVKAPHSAALSILVGLALRCNDSHVISLCVPLWGTYLTLGDVTDVTGAILSKRDYRWCRSLTYIELKYEQKRKSLYIEKSLCTAEPSEIQREPLVWFPLDLTTLQL